MKYPSGTSSQLTDVMYNTHLFTDINIFTEQIISGHRRHRWKQMLRQGENRPIESYWVTRGMW